jgi:phytoene desaturase
LSIETTEKYWSKKLLLLHHYFFTLVSIKKLENIEHHMLFFDTDFEKHAEEIYDNPKWPKNLFSTQVFHQ